jgi:hypothetical protein
MSSSSSAKVCPHLLAAVVTEDLSRLQKLLSLKFLRGQAHGGQVLQMPTEVSLLLLLTSDPAQGSPALPHQEVQRLERQQQDHCHLLCRVEERDLLHPSPCPCQRWRRRDWKNHLSRGPALLFLLLPLRRPLQTTAFTTSAAIPATILSFAPLVLLIRIATERGSLLWAAR